MKKISILALALVALIMLPIPLLPPQSLVEFAQSSLGLGAASAYLLCAITVQTIIYSVLGLAAAFAVTRAQKFRGRLLQTVAMPLLVAGWALMTRSLRAGHLPVLTNSVDHPVACEIYTLFGLDALPS